MNDRILEIARRRFGSGTLEETTMRSIAEEADVAVGTLYTYFRDKTALVEAISAEDLDREAMRAFATLPDHDLRAQLGHVFECFFAYYRKNPSLSRNLVRELSLADDVLSQQREQRFMALFTALSKLVVEAQARGEIVADVVPLDLAVNAFGLHYFYLVGWLSGQPRFDPPEPHVGRALDLLLRGLQSG